MVFLFPATAVLFILVLASDSNLPCVARAKDYCINGDKSVLGI